MKFIKRKEVLNLTVLSRTSVYRLMADGKFPISVLWANAPFAGKKERCSMGLKNESLPGMVVRVDLTSGKCQILHI